MKISPYAEKHQQLWSHFVDGSTNGTIFHQQEFLGYHPAGRFEWHHLMFGNPGSPEAVLPAAIHVDHQGRRLLQSPTGATLGGPVLKPHLGLEHTARIVRSLITYARQQRFRGIVLGTVPAIYWTNPDDTLEFALRDAGFEPTVQLMHYVDLRGLPLPDVMQSIPGKRRSTYRKALKQGLEFNLAETSEEIAEFYKVLCANKAAHEAAPLHTLDEILSLRKLLGQRLQIFCARKDTCTVAGVYTVAVTRRVCYSQYIADQPELPGLEATRFVLFRMLSELREQGFDYLDLGPSALLPVKKTSLALFKESLGAVGCERREWKLFLAT